MHGDEFGVLIACNEEEQAAKDIAVKFANELRKTVNEKRGAHPVILKIEEVETRGSDRERMIKTHAIGKISSGISFFAKNTTAGIERAGDLGEIYRSMTDLADKQQKKAKDNGRNKIFFDGTDVTCSSSP